MKETWKGSQIAGKDVWFQVHRLFMVATVLVSSLAFIVIAVEKGFFKYDLDFIKDNPHPVTGAITLLLAFAQPFIALVNVMFVSNVDCAYW
jgi:hypothetical protein